MYADTSQQVNCMRIQVNKSTVCGYKSTSQLYADTSQQVNYMRIQVNKSTVCGYKSTSQLYADTSQLYADDTQVYLNFNVTNTNDQKIALKKIEACVEEIRIWMIQHKLMMNDSQTEFIVIISIGKIQQGHY